MTTNAFFVSFLGMLAFVVVVVTADGCMSAYRDWRRSNDWDDGDDDKPLGL